MSGTLGGVVGDLEAALDLIRRLPPHNVEKNLEILTDLLPAKSTALRTIVDVPSTKRVCPVTNREFLTCTHNQFSSEVINSHHLEENNSNNNKEPCPDKIYSTGSPIIKESTGDSQCNDYHRSPWADVYVNGKGQIKTDEFIKLRSDRARRLELIANDAFSTYCNLYYDSAAISSAYFWDLSSDASELCPRKETNEIDDKNHSDAHDTESAPTNPEQTNKYSGVAGAILIKKCSDEDQSCWDSMHIVEISHAHYRLTSTISLQLATTIAGLDNFMISGVITRQNQSTRTLPTSTSTGVLSDSEIDRLDVAALGSLVEQMESRLRSSIQEIYFGATHDLVNEIRPVVPAGFLRHQNDLQREMAERLKARHVAD